MLIDGYFRWVPAAKDDKEDMVKVDKAAESYRRDNEAPLAGLNNNAQEK
jgi:hypothetical protein